MARRPNPTAALIDLAAALASLAFGAAHLPYWALAGVLLGHLGYWIATRARGLAALAPAQRAVTAVVSVGLIVLVDGGAFWFGQTIRGS